MENKLLKATFVLVIYGIFVSVAAAEDDWYALLPTITGDASIGAVEDSEIDVGPEDILNSLDLGGMIQSEALHKGGYGMSLAYNLWT